MFIRILTILFLSLILLLPSQISSASELKISGGNWVWERIADNEYGKGYGEITIQYLGYHLSTSLVEWQKNPELIQLNQGGIINDANKTLKASKIIIIPSQKQVEFYNIDYSDNQGISLKNSPKVVVTDTTYLSQIYRIYGPVNINVKNKYEIEVIECFYYPNNLKMFESNTHPIKLSIKDFSFLNNNSDNLTVTGNNAVIYRMNGESDYFIKLENVEFQQNKSNLKAYQLKIDIKNDQFNNVTINGNTNSQINGEIFDINTNEIYRIYSDYCSIDVANKYSIIQGNVLLENKTYQLKSNKIVMKNIDGRIIFELPERSQIKLKAN